MTTATIFAVTSGADTFAMKTSSGAVILATCDGGWTPAVGLQLEGVPVYLGPCVAAVVGNQQPVHFTVKVRNDPVHPTYWGGLE